MTKMNSSKFEQHLIPIFPTLFKICQRHNQFIDKIGQVTAKASENNIGSILFCCDRNFK